MGETWHYEALFSLRVSQTPDMLGYWERLVCNQEEKGTTWLFNILVFVTMSTILFYQVKFSRCHVYNSS